MSVRARLHSWWKALAHRSRLEEDLEAELHFHVESYAEDLIRTGISRGDALRRARVELGGVALQKEKCRSSLGLEGWDDLRADLRYALRQLRRAPAFTTTVLLVLALGIGANAAMFSVIDRTLLRWLPYHRPGRLVILGVTNDKGKPGLLFVADVEQWEHQAQSLAGLGYYDEDSMFAEVPGGGSRGLPAIHVSANFFGLLGVSPAVGRGFLPEEQTPGREKVVVLSEPVWRDLFAADPAIVGKQVRLNDEPYQVIGVMPRHFLFPATDTHPQIWVPVAVSSDSLKRVITAPRYSVIARLRDGVTSAATEAELSAIEKSLAPLYPRTLASLAPSRVQATIYRDTLVRDASPALRALLVAVTIIWLIACANVANLILARGMARQREIAVRGALGASRLRIIRQLFTESLLLSLAGAIAGLLLSQTVLYFFSKSLATKLNLPEHLAPNPAVLMALLALSFVSALLFGLFPAWLAARTPIDHSLRQSSTAAGQDRSRHRMQQAMVVAEIGLSLVLLMSCGLLLRTVFALRRVPLGFRTDHVLLVQPTVPAYKYRNVDRTRVVYRPLLERVQHMNGVQAASLTTVVPLRKSFESKITLNLSRGKGAPAPGEPIEAKLMAAGPELQDVLGFHMYQGRFFNEQDTFDSPPVAVVNRAFANWYAPDGDIIGHFKLGFGLKDRTATVVGVMDDFRQASIERPSMPEIDFCTNQLREGDGFYQPTMQAHIELALRTTKDPRTIIADLRRVMTEVNPDLQSVTIDTMDQVVEDSLGGQLLAAHLLELFAGSALVVALAGLYGLLIYLVTQRTQELGVRLALGAQRRDIISMLLLEAGRLLLAGAAIGTALAYFSGRLLAGFLYGVSTHDARTLLAVTGVLLFCGLAAAYLPARRASRVEPMEALRGE
jgi:predicted permease